VADFRLMEEDMAQRKTLTEAQVALLRSIGDGCPDGVMKDDSYRISAAALRSRYLVTTMGRGPTWNAIITQAGRDYLEQVDGANPPIPRQANVSVTQQLVDDVIAAGGSLRVPRKKWYESGGIDYENRVRLAERYGKVPSGRRIVATAVSPDELEIELVDAPDRQGDRGELSPVSVPEKIGRYHAAARQFRDLTQRHEVSRALLPRTTRIVHAIAVEADRRGWLASAPEETKNAYGYVRWTGAKDGHVRIEAGQHAFWIRLQEEGVRTRGPWEEEVRRYRNVPRDSYFYRDRELPSGAYDADARGRLKLELHSTHEWTHSGRQSRWADRQSWTLEDRLPHLLREIEERIVEVDYAIEQRQIAAEKAEEARRRAAEERERTWRVLIAEAKQRLIESHRAVQLKAEAEGWQTANLIRRYCDALETAFRDRPDTAEWLSWARTYAERLDPLCGPPRMPEEPEVSAEALQQYLPPGWSSFDPEHRSLPL
jgi:hypothetical protein